MVKGLPSLAVFLIAGLAIFALARPAAATCPVGVVTGTTFNTSPGDSCPNGIAAGAGGIINAPDLSIPLTAPTPLIAAGATAGGMIFFSDGSTISVPNTSAANALQADGAGSLIDARNGTNIHVFGNGDAVFMSNGALVEVDDTTVLTLEGSGTGILISNSIVPNGTIGSGVLINLNNSNGGGGTGLGAANAGTVTVDSLTVQGPGSAFGVIANVGSTITLTGTTSLTTNVTGGTDILATGAGALINGTSRPTIVNNNGNFNNNGALAANGGHIELTNGMDITVSGGSGLSSGVSALNAGSLLTRRTGRRSRSTRTITPTAC
jgi:hypothetical protein